MSEHDLPTVPMVPSAAHLRQLRGRPLRPHFPAVRLTVMLRWTGSTAMCLKVLARLRPYAAQYLFKGRSDVGSGQSHRDIGMEKTHLVPAIVPSASRLHGMERHAPDQPRHGVRELDFAASAGLLAIQFLEDFRLKDVAADDA